MIENFLISFAASLVAVVVVLWLERQRRARLHFMTLPLTAIPDGDLARQQCSWPQLELQNLACPEWIDWVYTREPALSCRVHVAFFRPCGEPIFGREMAARWSSSIEPRLEERTVGGVALAYLRDSVPAADIHSNHAESIHPIIIFPRPLEIFGWTNESYAYGWKHPDWQIRERHFVIRLRATTADREFIACFRVDVTGGYDHIMYDRLDSEFDSRYSLCG